MTIDFISIGMFLKYNVVDSVWREDHGSVWIDFITILICPVKNWW
jgi:hypothetical protein